MGCQPPLSHSYHKHQISIRWNGPSLHKSFSSNVKFLVILPSPPIRTPHRERLVIWMKRMVIGYIFVSGNSSIVVCGMAGLVFRRCFCRLPKSLCSGLQGYRRIQHRHSIQYRSPMNGCKIGGTGLARMLEAQSSLLRCCTWDASALESCWVWPSVPWIYVPRRFSLSKVTIYEFVWLEILDLFSQWRKVQAVVGHLEISMFTAVLCCSLFNHCAYRCYQNGERGGSDILKASHSFLSLVSSIPNGLLEVSRHRVREW